ncbi:MAG TPA: GTPase Era [bacterium]|nr:GTPase Era [bacterium]
MNDATHKFGYVALIGRPNAGKSTLLNYLLGTKLAAVTPKPQTTRNRIFGIFDREDAQIVFQDTPGLLEPDDAMHAFMVREAERALEDADVAVWLIDGIKGVTARERAIAGEKIAGLRVPLLIAFNKVDKVPLDQRMAMRDGLQGLELPPGTHESSIFYISSLYGSGVDELLQAVLDQIPEGPKMYPPDQLSDRTQRFFVAEIIREKAFLLLRQELPYALAVQVESMKERENGVTAIQAVMHVERDTQKGILVGKQGAMIKAIGMEARKELETMLGTKVFLELWVKVSEQWRKRGDRLRELGYAD